MNHRKSVWAIVVLCLSLLGLFAATSATAATVFSATVTAPSCGRDATLTLTTTRTTSTKFQIYRSGQLLAEVTLNGARATTVKAVARTNDTFQVKVDGTSVVSKTVSPSVTACPGLQPVLPDATKGVFSASIAQPSCGVDAPVTVSNGGTATTSFDIRRDGQAKGDVIISLVANRVLSVTERITASPQIVKVLRAGATIASTPVVQTAACSGGTTTTSTSTSSTSTSTSTTTTIPQPPCLPSDTLAAYGCPILQDLFDGTELQRGTYGWSRYEDPTGYAPRSRNNVRVRDGELQIVGTYDQATQFIMGAGVSQNFAQKHGRWEVRMRVEQGAGYAAAGLLWPKSLNWPTDGELDIFEIPRAERQSVAAFVHNGPTNYAKGAWTNLDATQWHTYAVEWTPTSVAYFYDGIQVYKTTETALVPTGSAMQLTLQMDARRFVDGCNGWYQCPNAQTPPEVVMHVDYAKVWASPS